MRLSSFIVALAAFTLTSWDARAQCGTGDGRVLNMPATAAIGESVTITMDAPPPSTMALLLFSLGEGPTDGGSYGTICLDFPPVLSFLLDLDANGHAELTADVPYDPSIIGITVYAQFLTCGGGGGRIGRASHGSSNQQSITFTDSDVCHVDDAIDSDFNGTAIAAGNYIWFNAVVDVKDLDTAPATMHFINGAVAFSANGTDYELPLPGAVITISDTATEASTTYDANIDMWVTEIPSTYSGNIFLTGAGIQFPAGLPGGIKPVTWAGTFSCDTLGVTFQWKWAAAVYTTFTDDPGAIGVKPIDGDKDNPYANSDHAGTPENFKNYVTGGARGGGGSNFTGSYSGTSKVGCQ